MPKKNDNNKPVRKKYKQEAREHSPKDHRQAEFDKYFSLLTKIVYTLTSINEHNEVLRRLNIDGSFDFTDEITEDQTHVGKNDREQTLKNLHESLKTDMRKIEEYKKYEFNIDRVINDLKLSTTEKYILYCITVYSLYTDPLASLSMRKLLELVSVDNEIYLRNYRYISSSSKLIENSILATSKDTFSSNMSFEIGQTLVGFASSKFLFSLLEETSYDILEQTIREQESFSSESGVSSKRRFESIVENITPKDIVAELDKAVIGQKRAKRVLAVQAYLHYMRVQNASHIPFRSNIMLIGPTGVGKTYLAQTLANILSLPFARSDVTTLTETGYVGDDVETVLYELYKKSGGDVSVAEKGIVFLDEIDKIAKAEPHQSTTGNPSDKAVQEALLSMLNGEELRVPEFGDRRMMHTSDGIMINTKNILFIFGGAFVGLDDIIKARLKGESSIGFSSSNLVGNKEMSERILEKVDIKDLEKYGMIPEFLGRVPIVATLHSLNQEEMRRILTHASDSPILKYQEFFKAMGKKFIVSDDVLSEIVVKATEMQMGARALKSIVENIMVNVLYNFDGGKTSVVKITKNDMENYYMDMDNEMKEEGDKSVHISDDKTYLA